MIRFFAPDIKSTLTLPESDSGHCCRVLRMKEGDEVEIIDGKGNSYHCVITNAHPKHTEVEIISQKREEKHWVGKITLAVAPTKNIDRMEWLLEKAVEIGIDRIVLLKCARSERKEVKLERLEKILISAMKQSMKATIPEIEGMVKFSDFISEASVAEKFVGYCAPEYPKARLVDEYTPGKDVIIMVGPEGDFSKEEIEEAVAAGYKCVTFGNTRLRTETAALYALANIHTINELNFSGGDSSEL